jgi:NAD(P)-dependent dehydrogenase (short-subunit alcohol dehydrogenase family)
MSDFVLVTGASGGIGAGLIKALSSAGWLVIGTDNYDLAPPQSITKHCYSWIRADLAVLSQDSAKLTEFINSICSTTQGADIKAIVHNAAYQCLGSFSDLSQADWFATLHVNLMAPIAINRELLPQINRQRGSIVHIGSIHNNLTKPGFTAYSTSKAALAGLTRSMAVELGGSVRVNAIEPAAIATPMLEASFVNSPGLMNELKNFHPTCTIGTPADVARAVLFLLDSSNSFINGCVLPLTGGIHARLHDPA